MSGRLPRAALPLGAAVLAFLVHLPFVLRYDLHFQPDFAVSALMSREIAFLGDRPDFFWGQGFQGAYGNYLTAVLFRIFGYALPIAGGVSLAIWSTGVGLAVWLGRLLLGERAARWAAAAAVIGSPYVNHYVTQPYLSYETAPVLAILTICASWWGERLVRDPLTPRAAVLWFGLGVLAGFGWWTTRLFVPAIVAVALAATLVAQWRLDRLRRVAAGLAIAALGVLLGAAPEIAYRLAGGEEHPNEGISVFAVAPLGAAPKIALDALRALPAYFNGDPRARVAEGVAFADRVAAGQEPYTGAKEPWLTPAGLLDGLAIAVTGAVLVLALARAVRARKERDGPLLALCLVPFVQLVLIGFNARAVGGYYVTRRYWFACVLVLALLFGDAIARADAVRAPVVRLGSRLVAVIVLGASLVAQGRMLLLADDLVPYRRLVAELVGHGEQSVFMRNWNVWVVSALSAGRLDGVSVHYNDERMLARVAGRPRLAFADRSDEGAPSMLGVAGVRFTRTTEAPHQVGAWRWLSYERAEPDG